MFMLSVIQKMCHRYKNLLHRLRIPHPGVIQVDGQTIQLPYRPKHCVLSRGEKIDDEQLQRIATSLSVSGHFSFRTKYNYPVFNCSGTHHSVERLLELRQLFGGSIRSEKNHVPVMQNHCWRWSVCALNAYRAARILATVSSPRQKLFAFIAESEQLSRDQRSNDALREFLKPEKLEMNCWASVGSLFDVRGHIGMAQSSSKFMRIRLFLKERSTIDGLVLFLRSHELPPGDVLECYDSKRNYNYFQWSLNGTDQCRQLLHLLLPHLIHRKSYVSYVLNHCRGHNFHDLAYFKGRQSYFARHDEVASQYVEQIAYLRTRAVSLARQKKLSHSSRLAAIEEVLQKIRSLQSTLNSHMLHLNVRRSKTIIRDALGRGAFVKPPGRTGFVS